MLLADLGAERIRIDRPALGRSDDDWTRFANGTSLLHRGSRSICLDLKSAQGIQVVQRLVANADILLEGFRPGVMEKLGLGPSDLHALNEQLIYARMTGWGQTGSRAKTAGHDINYLAVSGALHLIGRRGQAPVAPPAVFGDFAAGGSLMAFGIMCAVWEASRSGVGQVVDGSVLDGAALATVAIKSLLGVGFWKDQTGENLIDSGSYFYDVFECADGRFISVGALEPQFYSELLEKLGVDALDSEGRFDPAEWPKRKAVLATVFRSRPRDAWAALLENSDACVAPVLSLAEAPSYSHNASRGTFFERDGRWEVAPAPRFSRTSASVPGRPAIPGEDSHALLVEQDTQPAKQRLYAKVGLSFV